MHPRRWAWSAGVAKLAARLYVMLCSHPVRRERGCDGEIVALTT
jgi:hypothetical protein